MNSSLSHSLKQLHGGVLGPTILALHALNLVTIMHLLLSHSLKQLQGGVLGSVLNQAIPQVQHHKKDSVPEKRYVHPAGHCVHHGGRGGVGVVEQFLVEKTNKLQKGKVRK